MSYNLLEAILYLNKKNFNIDKYHNAILFIEDKLYNPKRISGENMYLITETLYHMDDMMTPVLEEYQEYLENATFQSNPIDREIRFYKLEIQKLKDIQHKIDCCINKTE